MTFTTEKKRLFSDLHDVAVLVTRRERSRVIQGTGLLKITFLDSNSRYACLLNVIILKITRYLVNAEQRSDEQRTIAIKSIYTNNGRCVWPRSIHHFVLISTLNRHLNRVTYFAKKQFSSLKNKADRRKPFVHMKTSLLSGTLSPRSPRLLCENTRYR